MARLVTERADTLPKLAEVFREHGYDGASLAVISAATGLGKGSLYNFFPGGKAEMIDAVLAEIRKVFDETIFDPLAGEGGSEEPLGAMFSKVGRYFLDGDRVCLMGALALHDPHKTFAGVVRDYFHRWIEVVATRLRELGWSPDKAQAEAEEIVANIQGAIVLTRATGDRGLFQRLVERQRERIGIVAA